jgi:hypothetical protein
MQSPGLPQLPSEIIGSQTDPTVTRIGCVTRFNAGLVTVNIGGSNVDCTYILQVQPQLADLVMVTRQGPTWVIVGTLSAIPSSNAILNSTFDTDAIGAMPANWTYQRCVGGVTDPTTVLVRSLDIEATSNYVHGSKVVAFFTPWATGGAHLVIDWMYSNPIPVIPGQYWTANGFIRSADDLFGTAVDESNLNDITAYIILAFFANSASPGVAICGATAVGRALGSHFPWSRIVASGGVDPVSGTVWLASSHGIFVPPGYTHLRVMVGSSTTLIRGSATTGAHVLWDRIIAQQVI